MQITRERLKDFAEALGIIAIVASLLFLSLEIQQSNRIAIASTEIGIRNGYSEFNRGLHSSPGLAELMARAMEPEVEWSPAEGIRVLMVVNDILNVWLSVETACENGLAQDATCEELYDDIRTFIALFPGTHSEWRFIIDGYPSLANTKIRITIQEALAKN